VTKQDYHVFNIIKHLGKPTKGVIYTPEGKPVSVYPLEGDVYEQISTFEGPEFVGIGWADYDNHFIYAVPENIPGPSYCCSCGSPAVWIGAKNFSTYSKGTKPKKYMFVCKYHLDYGLHADGSS